jgi:hypothetical protein
MWDAVWKVLQPHPWHSGIISTFTSLMISDNFPKSGDTSVVVTVWMCCHMPIHNCLRWSNTYICMTWMWMQFGRFYRLSDSLVRSFPHYHHKSFQRTFTNLGKRMWCKCMSVLPYAHPQLFKLFEQLIFVWHGCGMQFERFFSLNHGVVGSFPHLHHLWIQPALPNLGICLWW